jgi:hypothetical protein
MIQVEPTLVDDLLDEFGDGLRAVATYEDYEYEVEFMREDVRDDYSREEVDRVFRQVSIEGMGYENFQQLFHVGRLECALYGFEGALIFHFPPDPFHGLVVSIDRDVSFNPDAIIDICQSGIAVVE